MYQSSYPNGSPYHVPSAQNVQLSQFVDRLSASLGTTSGDGAGAQTSADNSAVAQQGQQQQQQLPPTHLAQPKLELEKVNQKVSLCLIDLYCIYPCCFSIEHFKRIGEEEGIQAIVNKLAFTFSRFSKCQQFIEMEKKALKCC